LVVPVGGEDEEGLGVVVEADFGAEDGAGFAAGGGGDGVDAMVMDGAADEEGVAVFAAVVVHGFAEEGLEAGHAGEFGEGIGAADAVGALVDLLEGDDVGVAVLDDAGDAFEVEAAVDAFAVVDVIGEDADFRAGAPS
jgi:hypothetical protein